MLIWAKKSDVDLEIIQPLSLLYNLTNFTNAMKTFKAWEQSIILRQIRKCFGERKDISILEFGTGICPFCAYLNHIGYKDVTCLDLPKGWHPEMNEEAYNKIYNACVKYEKADIYAGYDKKHDVIFSASVLEHVKRRARVMQILSRNLNPNGLFIHIVDYQDFNKKRIDFKDLIDNCSILILYNPKETPGCIEFKNPPKGAWIMDGKSRIAFFSTR